MLVVPDGRLGIVELPDLEAGATGERELGSGGVIGGLRGDYGALARGREGPGEEGQLESREESN